MNRIFADQVRASFEQIGFAPAQFVYFEGADTDDGVSQCCGLTAVALARGTSLATLEESYEVDEAGSVVCRELSLHPWYRTAFTVAFDGKSERFALEIVPGDFHTMARQGWADGRAAWDAVCDLAVK